VISIIGLAGIALPHFPVDRGKRTPTGATIMYDLSRHKSVFFLQSSVSIATFLHATCE
jgi:hypothetical protein